MKVGMIFECGPDGADVKVCEYLAKQIRPEISISSITLDNKDKLIRECGEKAEDLLSIDKCDKVVIVWDLLPPQRGKSVCRKREQDDIKKSLEKHDVDLDKVFLVCVEAELESWLLSDKRAIETVLSRPTHKVRVPKVRRPEELKNPKKRLHRIYKEFSGRDYTDRVDAIKIVKEMHDLNKIRKCKTFVRFALKATDVDLSSD